MKNITNIFVLTLVALVLSFSANAENVKGVHKGTAKATNGNARVAAGCLPGKASNELNLNNVRARINTGGDMWWDLQSLSKYEIPRGSGKTSMFSASLWLGGTDVNGQLKGAFQRFRGSGDDYWPGPLTTDGTASTSRDVCSDYDKHFVITREQVDEFRLKQNNPDYPDYNVPDIIKDWPAHGDISKGQSAWLAPFVNVDGDPEYNWQNGDYPYYDIENELCKPSLNAAGEYEYKKTEEGGILADAILKGDQTIWWIFNDNGNIHSETRGKAIGVEIKAQAFAFSTNDEINNMTFYTYEIINRSTYRLTNTYFSQWVDTDLGSASDDFVGCDVARGLGYCYNGVEIDGNGNSQDYGAQPPAVGVDFFQGPYMDPDGLDNQKYTVDGNGVETQICDESVNGVNFGDDIKDNERFGMRRFVYHNNPPSGVSATQDPDLAPEYYNLLRGIWKDGSKMTYGGDAYREPSGLECDFMFPDLTDECNWGTGGVDPGAIKKWTEQTEGNAPGDRRFMQSAGEFTLESGAINYITVGIPWARAASGGAWASVELLREVDDKAQALFDNCFKVLDGPDAPELIAQEMDKTIIIYLKNLESSNNANEDYIEEDVTISAVDINYDADYKFQGYQIFQLANDEVSIADIDDADKARLVAQCDIKDGVGNLVNFVNNDELGGNVPELMVEASDEGIVHSFQLIEDEFATGDKRLINNKKYYYVAFAYAYNEYAKYSQDPGTLDGLKGQKKPYLAGRKSALGPIKVHTIIPHMADAEANGTVSNSSYGDGPMITRLDGRGNGGIELQLTEASHQSILNEKSKVKIQYTNNHGPINVKVIDPLQVKDGVYELRFDHTDNVDTASWVLYKNGVFVDSSDASIELGDEQLFLEEGFSIQIIQNNGSGDIENITNGFISAKILYADSSRKWLNGWPDIDGASDIDFETPSAFNWIRSGTIDDESSPFHNDYDPAPDGTVQNPNPDLTWYDPDETYEKLLGGTWAPYRLASNYDNGPAAQPSRAKMNLLESVDIVYTDDKSLWTHCVVFETGDDSKSAEGEGAKLHYRKHASVDKDGNYTTETISSTNPDDANYIDAVGMGWFPGYAISLETGERLNIAFGESSWLVGENGRDMLFNPTANYSTSIGDPLMGGKHFVYIFRNAGGTGSPAYDGGKWLREILNKGYGLNLMQSDIMWVSIPMANASEEWLSNEARVQLRVDYKYQTKSWTEAADASNAGYPAYEFSTGNIATTIGDSETAKSALDLIRVVPNPYYAFSAYETDQVDNRVRITNLPQICTIKIYGTSGTLVRVFDKDESNTWIDWNLKNTADIPVASGVYYIHIDAPDIGEVVIKWFGVLRPTDMNAF